MIVLATAAIMHWGVPWLNDQFPYRDEVRAGETMTLEYGVVVTPPAGWSIRSGVITGEGEPTRSVELVSGATIVELTSARWSRSLPALFRTIRTTETENSRASALRFTGTPTAFTSASGEPGLLSSYTSTTSSGVIGAVLVDGVGVEVQVVSPTAANDPLAGDLGSMLESIRSGSAS